jgi:hypothetical protein
MNRLRMMTMALATLCLFASCPAIAGATIGVGTTTPRIVIDQDVQPGGIYRLPAIPVINTGTERSDFRVFVDRASKQSQLFADPRWITVSPGTVSIEASQSALINATIQVPLTVRPGEYQALIVAQPLVPGASADTPNVQVGTKVVFRIVQSNVLVALYWRIRSLADLWAPWSYVGLALVVGLPLGWFLMRRYRVSFAVSRRQ